MAGIFNGIGSTLTGKGGGPGSQLPKEAIPILTSYLLDNLSDARTVAQQFGQREEAQWASQQAILPEVLRGLGYDVDWDGSRIRGISYRGTEAQNAVDQLARQGWWSQPAQYANLGYEYRTNADGSVSIDERSDSQRNKFLDSMGREIGTASGIRDQALQQLYASIGQQGEAVDATRRQLQTAEGAQVGSLQQLGFGRDQWGNIVKDPTSNLSAYETMLLQQARTAQGVQGSALGTLGYGGFDPDFYLRQNPDVAAARMDPYEHYRLYGQQEGRQANAQGTGVGQFDPNSSVGQMFAQLDRLRSDAAGQTALAGDTQAAALQRLGLRQGAAGWENDPTANEAVMRGLQAQYLQRAQAAMRGDAPVDPGVERALAEEERGMRETLTRQLGPGWENSSAGIEALRNFNQRANETRYRVQQDALGLGTQQAMGLQGVNLQTLSSLYASNDPVLRAMAAEAMATQAAQQTRASNAAAASGISAQGAGTIANLAGTQSNISAQTLASLYGLTAPALAAAGQLGNLTNANLAATQAGYANVGNLGQNIQQAIAARAQGALGFQELNMRGLAGIPANIQQLYTTANQGRMGNLAALYPALESGYSQPDKLNLVQLYGQLGSVGGQAAGGYGSQIMQGDQFKYQTNINNIFWQNFMKSFGQSAGSYVGSGGMGGM